MQRVIKNWKNPDEFSMPIGVFKENTSGRGRKFMSVQKINFREEAFQAFGFYEIKPEPNFFNFIGLHYEDGAFTHEHTDFAQDGFMHVRANWLIKKPQIGGDPVISGKIINVDAGDLWICFASEETHSSIPCYGGDRLLCSFGATIKKPKDFDITKVFS